MVEVLMLLFTFFQFFLLLASTAKSTILLFLFFVGLITIRSSLLAEIRWSVCVSKPHMSLWVSFYTTAAGLCTSHLFVWSNLNFLHISLWITLPTQSCLVLYSFCDNLLYSLVTWFIVSSLSPHNLDWYFVASYLFLPWFYWFFWRCFMLLLGEILFLFKSFHFLASSWFSRVRCCLFVV